MPGQSFTHIDDVERALNEFFRWPERKVFLLKGPWGSGKSYFLRDYYLPKRQAILPKYIAFASVFGCKSASEVETRIIGAVERTSTWIVGTTKFNQALKDLGMSAISNWQLRLFGVHIPIPLSALVSVFSRAKPLLVVLDDLERLNPTVRLGEVLGLVSNLAENTRAEFKVILVCNDDKLKSPSSEDLATYREKVLHSELSFNPHPSELVERFFPHPDEKHVMLECLRTIDEGNIRIIRRVSTALTEITQILTEAGAELLPLDREKIVRLSVFYYRASTPITKQWFDQLQEYALELYSDDRQALDKLPDGQLFKDLNAGWSEVEPVVIEWLQTGTVTAELVRSVSNTLKENRRREELDAAAGAVYKRFTDNFACDSVEAVAEPVQAFLQNYADKIPLGRLIGYTNFLKKLGADADPWFEMHVHTVGPTLSHESRREYLKALPDGPARSYIESLHIPTELRDVGTTVASIVAERGWGQKDVETLLSASEIEIRGWLEKPSETETLAQLRVLLELFQLGSPESKERAVAQRLTDLLKTMAKSNPVHHLRVTEFLRIPLDSQSDSPETTTDPTIGER